MGRGLRRTPARHVRVRHLEPRDPVPGARPPRHQAPVLQPEPRRGLRFASTPQALLAAGGVDTGIDAVALHHLFTLHAVVPAPRTIYNGIRKLAPGTTLTVYARGELQPPQILGAESRAPAAAEERGRMDRSDPRQPAPGGQEAHRDCRRQGRRAALRRTRFEPAGGAAGRAGRAGPDDLLGRLRGPAGRARQRVRILRPGGGDVRHPPPQVPDPQFRGAAPPARSGGADVRADVRAGRGGVLSAGRTGQPDGEGGAERAGRGRSVRRLLLVSAHGGGNGQAARSTASASITSTATTTSFWT